MWGEERADGDAALAVMGELPGARPDVAVLVEHRPLGLERHGPPRLGREPRLGVERVDVREPARHVAEDDVLHLRREMRRLRRERTVARLLHEARIGPVGHQGRQREEAEAARRLAQHLPARGERPGGGVATWIKTHGRTSGQESAARIPARAGRAAAGTAGGDALRADHQSSPNATAKSRCGLRLAPNRAYSKSAPPPEAAPFCGADSYRTNRYSFRLNKLCATSFHTCGS